MDISLPTELQMIFSKNPQISCFAIVDAGKDDTYHAEILKLQIPKFSLFSNTLEEDLQHIGPWLLQINEHHITNEPILMAWLEKINHEKKAVTWAFCKSGIEEVAQHLQSMLNWKTPNNDIALIRFYDQSLIDRFVNVLSDEQQRHFFGLIFTFAVFENGKFTIIRKPKATENPSAVDNALSEGQLKTLNLPERDSYLKRLLAELQENSNNAPVYHMDEKQTLSRMREGWDIAVKWRLYSVPTLSEWAAMSILVPQFYHHAGVREAVAGAKNERDADLHARDIMSLMRYDLNKRIDARERK